MTRGDSAMRVTVMAKEKSTSAKLAAPEIGAAELIMRRRRQRHVAFAGQQARGRIEADPAGAGQIDLGPGVQVGEVGLGAARARPAP